MIVDILHDIRIWTLFAILSGVYVYIQNHRRRPPFPVINTHANDFLGRKANQDYATNASALITNALTAHPTLPFALTLPNAYKVVLPASLSNFVKSNRDLDHRELVRQDFYAGYPGFEAQDVLHASGDMLLDIIKTKLGQNDSVMPVLSMNLDSALRVHWGEESEWRMLNWHADTTVIIACAASSVFVGPEKCEDEEWLKLVQEYVMVYFSAVGELHAYPAWSRRIIQRFFSPNASACRRHVARAREIMRDVLADRERRVEEAKAEGRDIPVWNDALAWTQAAPGGKEAEAGDLQLSLAMAAMFTTSELFRQVLIDVASHPDIIAPLREESQQQIAKHGISVAATNGMVFMDSVLKESQRRSAAAVALERVALRDVKLPTGHTLQRGTHIMVDSTSLFSPAHYSDPDSFVADRFLRKREAGDKSSQFVQSGPDYSVFGGGRHICPGRFFAGNELKMAMAHVLEKYDIRVKEGYVSKPLEMGVYKVVDPMMKFEVRRRKRDECVL
ncbi:cytochrome P450 [Alternaria rosae]|uniref:cytochrome P450 n=1 Tax=Alternaria rosae TaxID=1187941 RepID=UPI001E8E6475|nr:cytochrome P450 [Alternaria rosae]KAH6858992.1 cytochrome P450 [Alternaria rosae]